MKDKKAILVSIRFVVNVKGNRLMRVTLPAIWSAKIIETFTATVVDTIKEINEKRYGVTKNEE